MRANKKYELPEIEIMKFDLESVITTSNGSIVNGGTADEEGSTSFWSLRDTTTTPNLFN